MDSNATIPLDCEEAGQHSSSDNRENATELIDLEVVVKDNRGVTKCFEDNSLPVSEEALNLSRNNDLSEPPGNFTFINLGFAPVSVSRGLFSMLNKKS